VTGVDPTTAPEPANIVWRDRDRDYWRFDGNGMSWSWTSADDADICCPEGWSESSGYWQQDVDNAWGPLVAVGHLPAWTGPDDDVEPDDVPAVTP
jgi:hypothetical protein